MSRAGDSPSTRPLQSATYLFSVGSAAVLGSSNVSTPKALEICQVSPALRPAAPEDGPEDGRTPLNRCRIIVCREIRLAHFPRDPVNPLGDIRGTIVAESCPPGRVHCR